MAPVPVRVHVPHGSHSLMDELTHGRWVFRSLRFHACLGPITQGFRNVLTMQLVQANIVNNAPRYLVIEPVYDPSAVGKVTQIDVLPVSGIHFDKEFRTTPYYEYSMGSNKPKRIEYTHKELMYYLSDSHSQQRFLENATSKILFWQNLVEHLANLRMIAPESVQEFCTMVNQLGLGPLVPNPTL